MQSDCDDAILRSGQRATGHLLQFLAPGLVHSLGNSLFAIRGGLDVIAADDSDQARALVRTAVDRTEKLMGVLRHVADLDSEPDVEPPNQVLARLVDAMKVPLRDRGIGIDLVEEPSESAAIVAAVDAGALTRSVCEVVTAAANDLPVSLGAVIQLRLAAQGGNAAEIEIRVVTPPSRLPFPSGLRSVVELVQPRIAPDRVVIADAGPECLRLRVPVQDSA